VLLRRFSPDPFRPGQLSADDLRGHQVVQTILRRRAEGSLPGARTDGRRVALVIEVEKARFTKLPFEHTPPDEKKGAA